MIPLPPTDRRIHQLRVQIWAKDVQLYHARKMRDRHSHLSAMGWLSSIGSLAAGTLVAVFSAQKADGWADEVSRLEHERTRLFGMLNALEAEQSPSST